MVAMVAMGDAGEGAVAPSRVVDELASKTGRGCVVDSECGSDHYCDGYLFSYNSAVPGCCNPVLRRGGSYWCTRERTSGLGQYCVPDDECARSGHVCSPDLFAANFSVPGCCVEKGSEAPTAACTEHPRYPWQAWEAKGGVGAGGGGVGAGEGGVSAGEGGGGVSAGEGTAANVLRMLWRNRANLM